MMSKFCNFASVLDVKTTMLQRHFNNVLPILLCHLAIFIYTFNFIENDLTTDVDPQSTDISSASTTGEPSDSIPLNTPMSPSTISTTSSNITTTTTADDHRLLERSVSSPTHTTNNHSHDHHKLPPLRLLSNESDDRSTIAPLSDSPRALLIQSTPVKKLGHRRAFSTDFDLYVFCFLLNLLSAR